MPKASHTVKAEILRAYERATELEMVGRNCKRLDYQKINKVPTFKVEGEFIAYASPDSTWAVTKNLIEAAEKSVLIGIYDFTAAYVKELLIKKMLQGVKVSLMLDLDGRTGEDELYQDLVDHGCEGVPAPSCASRNGAKYFASSHEKVIVIDDLWTLVQSGNYSDSSIPMNDKDGGDPDNFTPGNRDMGVAVKDKALSAFFTKILRSDMDLERNGPGETEGLKGEEEAVMLEAAPTEPPSKLFASKPFNPKSPVEILPILSPDNYMSIIPDFLESATKSIFIEQQYIRGSQDDIGFLLQKIRTAMDRHRKLDVRIVLAKPFPGKRFKKEADAIEQLGEEFGLKLGKNIRILNPRFFVHCHNKLIVVDDQAVLVSSQNWSDSAVSQNREAGLLMHYPDIAKYYSGIFETDWDTGLKNLAKGKKTEPEFFAESSANGTRTPLVELNWGDYVWV